MVSGVVGDEVVLVVVGVVVGEVEVVGGVVVVELRKSELLLGGGVEVLVLLDLRL